MWIYTLLERENVADYVSVSLKSTSPGSADPPNRHSGLPALTNWANASLSPGSSSGECSTPSDSPFAVRLPSPGGERKLRIVLAEDNPGDVYLVREALQSHQVSAELIVYEDGEEMLRFLNQVDAGEEPCPDLVLLDLNLPKRSGEVLLKRIRESPLCTPIPVVIVTSSDSPRDRETSTRLGANSYFRKPPDFEEFLKLGSVIKRVINRDLV